jgi:hypothetical protein
MPDLYIHNPTTKYLDANASIHDLAFRRNTIIPPGSQGHLALAGKDAYDAAVAFYIGCGLTCRSTAMTGIPVVEIFARPFMAPKEKAANDTPSRRE